MELLDTWDVEGIVSIAVYCFAMAKYSLIRMAGMLLGISVVTTPPRHRPRSPSVDHGIAAFGKT